jgi:protein-S-isoprenylcysteine O-methyltransferase Ste14
MRDSPLARTVMAGLGPVIHVFASSRTKDVDGRAKPGRDGKGRHRSFFRSAGLTHCRTFVSRLRADGAYQVAVRDLGCAWFLLLAIVQAYRAFAHLRTTSIVNLTCPDWGNLLAGLCTMAIYLSFAWFILHRPRSVVRADGILPSLVAFAGTYLPWSLVLFAADLDPKGQALLPAAFLVTGSVAAVVTVFHLGRSFSIVPMAQRLVRGGPYAFVRHPLYLAEEVALLGCLLRFLSPLTLALFILHCALQVGRILFEEHLLRRVFPDYDDYARATSRLIPYVW